MKCPNMRDYRAMLYDGDAQCIEGQVVLPPGIRIDRRVQRPIDTFYTSQRFDSDGSRGPETGSRYKYSEQPFLHRDQRDGMPVPSMSNHERPKNKRYK